MNSAAYVWAPNQLSVRSCIKKYKGCNIIFTSVLLQHLNAACIQALASDQQPFFFLWCHPLQSGGGGVRQPLSLRKAVSHQSRLAGCSEQQQQHQHALTETDGRLRRWTNTSATKYLIRNRIQSGVEHEKQKQNPLDSTKTEPPSLQEQSGWSANNKAVAICAFSCSFCYICWSGWQPALTSAFHPLVIYLLKPTAVNHGWGHATIAHLLFCAEKSWAAHRTALWASSLPRCRPSLLAKVFHYELFCLRASGAAHYDNHSGRVGYAPRLLCIVLLWLDTMACAGPMLQLRVARGGVGVWGGLL